MACLLLLHGAPAHVRGVQSTVSACVDEDSHCKQWSQMGECENNPGYMLTNCKDACDLQTMEVAASFYDLSAETASGGRLDFETLRDKVVLITNVASE